MQNLTTLFGQFLSLVPTSIFSRISEQYKPVRKPCSLSRWDQFVHLPHIQFAGRKSRRNGGICMNAASDQLYRLGTKPVARSIFADANSSRPYIFFEAFFGERYQRCQPVAQGHKFSPKNKLFSLDASVVDLCLVLFPRAKFRTTKAGIKLHALLL